MYLYILYITKYKYSPICVDINIDMVSHLIYHYQILVKKPP